MLKDDLERIIKGSGLCFSADKADGYRYYRVEQLVRTIIDRLEVDENKTAIQIFRKISGIDWNMCVKIAKAIAKAKPIKLKEV